MTLSTLRPGRRFVVVHAPTLRGKLVSKGECSATVRYDGDSRTTTISLETEIQEN